MFEYDYQKIVWKIDFLPGSPDADILRQSESVSLSNICGIGAESIAEQGTGAILFKWCTEQYLNCSTFSKT